MSYKFSTPGKLGDLSAQGKQRWHEQVNDYFKSSKVPPDYTYAGTRNQFFNPAEETISNDAITKSVGWTAFPREVQIVSGSDEQRWKTADSNRAYQVEYCEWSVERNSQDKVTKITFTCEDKHYWRLLAETDPNLVVKLYQKHISSKVEKGHLFDSNNNYIFKNRWNRNTTDGAMHMISRPNTIGAAVELAAGAAVVRARSNGTLLTGARELIECGGYGAIDRHSDPTIGEDINELARAGHFVSLADPAELSFESISFSGWKTPDNSNPADYWKYTRGVEGHYVRGVLEVPADKGFVVGDMKINGEEIYYGGQVADFIRIKIVGLAHQLGEASVEVIAGCLGDAPAMMAELELSAEEFFVAAHTRAGVPMI